MHILYLTDRLSVRGGADMHLRQVMESAVGTGASVMVAFGRRERGVTLPDEVSAVRVRGLAAPLATRSRLGALPDLLPKADVVHVQNVMNPEAVRMAVATGSAVVTVQDHRVLCPGMGKTLADGSRCSTRMSNEPCRECLPDDAYRTRTLSLTRERRDALRGARLVVLSRYMADELGAVGLPDASVVPPWVETGTSPAETGHGFLLAGRLVPHKGVVNAWRAWRSAATGQPLVVAGAGGMESGLEGADLRGWLPHSDLLSLLRSSRALLFPGWWQEPFGIVGVEALAQGTPVVLAAGGGTGEWSGAGCLRTAPGDTEAMARAISLLAGDPGLARDLGEQGRAAVAMTFSRSRIEPRLRDLYVEACARGSRGRAAR